MRRVLDIVRRWSDMPIAIQLGHAGRKASTEVPWKGEAQISPSQANGWQTVAPSALSYEANNCLPDLMNMTHVRPAKIPLTGCK